MSHSEPTTRARRAARPKRGPRILAALIAGTSFDEIAKEHKLPPKRVERLLCDELERRWVAPAREYARLQIARLETISAELKDRAERGDLATIDRLLRIIDRMDRYHGFSSRAATDSNEYVGSHAELMAILNRAASNLGAS